MGWESELYKLRTYHCDGFRAVRTFTVNDAAEIFAGRAARKAFGKRRGYCHLVHNEGWSGDLWEFEAFIGTSDGEGGTVGRKIRFIIYPGKTA